MFKIELTFDAPQVKPKIDLPVGKNLKDHLTMMVKLLSIVYFHFIIYEFSKKFVAINQITFLIGWTIFN